MISYVISFIIFIIVTWLLFNRIEKNKRAKLNREARIIKFINTWPSLFNNKNYELYSHKYQGYGVKHVPTNGIFRMIIMPNFHNSSIEDCVYDMPNELYNTLTKEEQTALEEFVISVYHKLQQELKRNNEEMWNAQRPKILKKYQ